MSVILGLTGSIGMGKSTVARMFAEAGVPVFDADAVVHRLQGPEGALVAEIEAAFPGTTGPDGVNRTALAERVLAEPDDLRRLEGLIHPAVRREQQAFLAAHAEAPVNVLDIPLLFEMGLDAQCDKVAVVSADAVMQRLRTLARP
jgi:dephospho-CoA kinase